MCGPVLQMSPRPWPRFVAAAGFLYWCGGSCPIPVDRLGGMVVVVRICVLIVVIGVNKAGSVIENDVSVVGVMMVKLRVVSAVLGLLHSIRIACSTTAITPGGLLHNGICCR